LFLDLFDETHDTLLDFLSVSVEVGGECQKTFVVDVEWGRNYLWKTKFFQNISEVNDFRSSACVVLFLMLSMCQSN
jgi:hypothetical protein